VSAFLSKMFDVGDLPVQTFGSYVMYINDGVIKWFLKLHTTFFNVFYCFKI